MLREAIEDAKPNDPASQAQLEAAAGAYFQVLRRLEDVLGVGRPSA
jgi:hypothetical protein